MGLTSRKTGHPPRTAGYPMSGRLLVRMPMCGSRMLVSSLAVLVRRGCVCFRLVVLALRMLMCRLMMVMRGGLMSGSGVVMMIAGRMLGRLSHLIFLLWIHGPLRSSSLLTSEHHSQPSRDYLAASIPTCPISSLLRAAICLPAATTSILESSISGNSSSSSSLTWCLTCSPSTVILAS
jgi:hypothetical protein